MNHVEELRAKDAEYLEEIDSLRERLDLEIESAISLVMLYSPVKKSFERSFEIVGEMCDSFSAIDDRIARQIAVLKINDALNTIENKIGKLI